MADGQLPPDGFVGEHRAVLWAGVLDRGDGLVGETARGELGDAVERRADPSGCARIHAGDDGGKARDQRRHAADAEIVDIFRPADEAIIGRELQEREIPPAGIGLQGLDPRDAHPGLPAWLWRDAMGGRLAGKKTRDVLAHHLGEALAHYRARRAGHVRRDDQIRGVP